MQTPQFLPADINVEVLLSYFKEGECKVSLHGLHKRNSYNDIAETEELSDGSMHISVGRKSLYNALPEYMFHPVDRFDNLPKHEEKERFQEELEKQEEEMQQAYRFFAPIDILLLKLRTDVRTSLEPLASGDVVMQQIIGDSLTDAQRANRFIKQALPFLPSCKLIRGNRTLLSLLLRKIFKEEGLQIDRKHMTELLADERPRYEDSIGMTVGEGYLGNSFYESSCRYVIHYWSDDECGKDFLQFVDDVELFRLFVKDFFLGIEEDLLFDISQDEPPLRLSDDVFYNYLNYNTNI